MSPVSDRIDWVLFLATVPLVGAGLITLYPFAGEGGFFLRQSIWFSVAVLLMFLVSRIDFRVLRKTQLILGLYLALISALLLLFLIGSVFKGAQSWFNLGLFAFQPADPMKLALILLLAKYFSRRHVEIARPKHVLISGAYALLPFLLVLVQPDFGSAIIIAAIWLGMSLASGISKKHLFSILGIAIAGFAFLWLFVFQPYQQARIMTFLDPLADLQGAGYNAYQSAVAVGSGELLGRGIGYGTQSRLRYLPEFQTDFIFAAFAEEWGYVGILLLFLLFGIVFWRIFVNAIHAAGNFEMLFMIGLATLLMTHTFLHIGINVGLLPVTGLTLPFLSYGGSHLLTTYLGLGILMGMRVYARSAHRDSMGHEFVGTT
jgi:rod shape determining protein RodA